MTDVGSGGPAASDAAFARACERGEIPNAEFRHGAHLRLALAYLNECGSADAAAERMAATLRAFAERAGHPEKYHHTITLFWMRMVARLMDTRLPFAYYSAERLADESARAGWIEPDLQAFDDAPTRSGDSPCDAPDRSLSR